MIIPEFEIDKGVLKKYRGHESRVDIPYGVTDIASRAFDCYTPLVSVRIPDTVISIGDYAFEGCERLTDIVIPQKVCYIGEGAFEVCKKLREIHIPEGVLSLKAHVFDGCEKLTSITLPESLNSIGTSAFHWCRSLKSILIPDNTFEFGQNIFNQCTSLTNITYRNVSFNPNAYRNMDIPSVLSVICHKDISRPLFKDIRTVILFRMLAVNPDDTVLRTHITEHFGTMFRTLIDMNEIDTIKGFLTCKGFFSQDNIDEWIFYAIDTQKTEIQVMLTNYKYEHIGYQSVEEIIQKRFTL